MDKPIVYNIQFYSKHIKASTLRTMYKSKTFQTTTFLHCTSSEAALDVAFPMMLLATHRYSPLSVLLTFVISKSLLSDKILILELLLVSMGDPSLVHDIVGIGIPSALQDKVTSSPSFFGPVSG